MFTEELSFEHAGILHPAIRLSGNGPKNPVLYVHGAGTGSKERILAIAPELTEGGLSIISFDQSGAGGNAEQLAGSSLERRTNEAIAAAAAFMPKEPFTVIGSSMGAYVALKLLDRFPIKSLVLMYPAVYSRRAFSVPFGNGFREIIREPNSWQNTDVLEPLRAFTGKLLIAIGEKDEKIPAGVVELLESNAPKASLQETVWVPEAPHQLMEWLREHGAVRKSLTRKIIEYAS